MCTATLINDVKELLETHEKEPSLMLEKKINSIRIILQVSEHIKIDYIENFIKNTPIQ